jgi:mono/diheme cytochrome c family protein
MHSLTRLLVWFSLAATYSICAATEDVPQYDSQIAPLIKAHCVKCHGPAKQEGMLNLSTAAHLVRGNDEGVVIVPHDLEASRLWKQVQSDEMPPDSPLSVAQKALLQRWIQSGAPGLSSTATGKAADQHWSFRPFGSPKVPTVLHPEEIRNEIDFFVQAALEASHITPNSEADKRMLIRRVALM